MGLIHIYCGDGKGKTTASVGLTLRALGNNMKVIYCQFFKDGKSSEIKMLETFDNLTYKKPKEITKMVINMNKDEIINAKKEYLNLFNSVIDISKNYDMLVLDEIISACTYDFIDENIVIEKIKSISQNCEIVLTGRDPSKKLCKIADYISNVEKIKHPYDNGIVARKGIEF